MSYIRYIVLVALLPTLSSAQYFASEWQAIFGERSCFVAMKAAPVDGKEFDFLEAKVSFYRPHLIAERRHEEFPTVVADPVILYVQVLPLWSAVENSPLSSVEVRYGDIKSKLTLDPAVGESNMPAYILGGDDAASAWEHLKADLNLFVVLTYGVDQKTEIEVSSNRIGVASAMYDACVTFSGEKYDK